MSSLFSDDDPTSPAWRQGFTRFLETLLDGFELPVDVLKEQHHRGWRSGVVSVKRNGLPPKPPRDLDGLSRRAWSYGSVSGRKAALEFQDAHPNTRLK